MFDVKKKRLKQEVKNSQVCLIIYEIMNKLSEYFECDLIAKVAVNKQTSILEKEIDFFAKMPILKRKKFEEDESGNEQANLNLDNKIIYFPTEPDNERSVIEKKGDEDNDDYKNKVLNSKNKDKDKIEHNYNKITPKEEEGKVSQDADVSYSDKKKSPNSDKSTSKSSGKFSNSCNNEVLIKLSSFKYVFVFIVESLKSSLKDCPILLSTVS